MVFAKTMLPLKASVHDASSQQVHKPVVIRLNQKLAHIDTAALSLTPDVEGEWAYEPGILLASDTVVFTPKGSLRTNTDYTVKMSSTKRIFGGSDGEEKASFRTEAAPRMVSSTLTDSSPLGATSAFNVTLSSPNRNLRDLELRTAPAVELARTSEDDTTFSWKPKDTWPQGTVVEVEVIDAKNGDSLKKTSVQVAQEPVISAPVKATYFTDKDVAEITFSQPIDTKDRPDPKFNLEGKGEWASDTVYKFVPTKVEPGKEYTYSVNAGLRSKQGGMLTQAFQGSFKTTGAVAVIATSPAGASLRQSTQELSFKFDQPVDEASVEARFSVSHGTIGQKRWSGNTLFVPVSNLGFQQTVTARIAAGVKNKGFGLPSAQAYVLRFTTENRTTRLNVPFYRQQHSATCAAASLKMALAYRGIATSEEAIVSSMGYQPRPIDKSTNPPTWDDPTEMFVGSMDGSIRNGTGAGPDAPPVAKASQALGRSAQSITRASVGWIASQVHAGNPVVMFGAQSATSGTTTWQTSTGKMIVMNLTSHATLVTGVVGEPSQPIGFWVSDPLSGANAYWSAAAVAANISRDPDGQAVVVY